VISDSPEWKFAVVGSGAGTPGPPSPWTPSATPSPATSASLEVNVSLLRSGSFESVHFENTTVPVFFIAGGYTCEKTVLSKIAD
jgi:hypothetical protein